MITLAVLGYQAFFVALMYFGSRIGPGAGLSLMIVALLWTLTHIFLPPLMLLQSVVIVTSWWWFGPRRRRNAAR
jgi:hypothetical protein